MIAGNGASRNDVYDAENTWTTSALASSRRSSGQYASSVATVRTYFSRPAQRSGLGRRVDGHQPRLDVRIVAPGAEQTVGLDGLAAENSKRWGDHRNLEAHCQISSGLRIANGAPTSSVSR